MLNVLFYDLNDKFLTNILMPDFPRKGDRVRLPTQEGVQEGVVTTVEWDLTKKHAADWVRIWLDIVAVEVINPRARELNT